MTNKKISFHSFILTAIARISENMKNESIVACNGLNSPENQKHQPEKTISGTDSAPMTTDQAFFTEEQVEVPLTNVCHVGEGKLLLGYGNFNRATVH